MQNSRTDQSGRRRRNLIFLVPVFALIALITWAVATPVGSSPDDDYHLASAWCALGDRPGLCEAVPGHPEERALPKGVAQVLCNSEYPTQLVKCDVDPDQAPTALIPTERGNFAGTYPPVFYTVMGVFASSQYAVSAIVMRIVNAVLFVGLTSLLYLFLNPSRRRTLLWMWTIGVVPLGLSLLSSNNPSSWAIIAGGSLWLAALGWFESSGKRAIGLGILTVVFTIMGAGARADSAIYAILGLAVACILAVRRARVFWLKAILPAALVIVAALFYFGANQSVGSSGLSGSHEAVAGMTTAQYLWDYVLELPQLWAGSLGTWPIGWLDIPMPALVSVAAVGVFGAFAFAGLRSASWRKLIALAFALVMMFAVPAWVLFKGSATVGQEVQPRYVLPLLLMFAGIALIEVGRRISFTRVQIVVATVALGMAGAAALHVTIRRYVTGLQVTDINLNSGAQWWWGGPVSPMLVWLIGSAAFAAAVFFALWCARDSSADRTIEPGAALRND
ncbi:DUF2142 domain-containing protein [Leifsonia sp. NPDC058292]|uniref:DUF2142 domain-containing protein n=1 Tax=Leifsonia sp. NPDC058292 TaxID=3346428 RepID=UPI0036DA725C